DGKFEIVNQAYRLRQSLCFRKSQGRLTCVTCHDPHNAPRGEAAVARYREKCVGCHATVGVTSHPDLRAADCASCHMPRRRAEESPEKAAEMFRRAAAQDPSLAQVRYNLGLALEAAGKWQEARAELEQALRMRVPFPDAHYALANLLVKTGELPLAASHYQEA